MTEQEPSTNNPLELILAESDLLTQLRRHSILLWLLFPGFLADALTTGYTVPIFAYMTLILGGFVILWSKMLWTLTTSEFSVYDWGKSVKSLSLVLKGMYGFFVIACSAITIDYAYQISTAFTAGTLQKSLTQFVEVDIFIPIVTLGLLVFLPIQHRARKIQERQKNADDPAIMNADPNGEEQSDPSHPFPDEPSETDYNVINSSEGVKVVRNPNADEPSAESSHDTPQDGLTADEAKGMLQNAQSDMVVQQVLSRKSNPYALTAGELEALEEHEAVEKYFALAQAKMGS